MLAKHEKKLRTYMDPLEPAQCLPHGVHKRVFILFIAESQSS
jgi:hypothetical protein